MSKNAQKLQIIPLGGLGEIGKNMTVVRVDDEILLIDSGLMFPEEDMLGIDLVIPDITYLMENQEKIRAIVLTHGHEDHIGALPYVLRQLSVPVYGTRLTLGILEGRLKENGVDSSNLHSVMPGDIINAGCFSVGFLRVNHSIPDAVGLSIKTPVGMIVHTGDFKFDYTPIDGKMTDFRRFSELGNKGVLVMMADSTNSEKEGHTPSESTVGVAFDKAFHNARQRIIVATFSSNVHRIQQVIDTAVRYKRRVAVLGRSMVNVVNISLELGYINAPEGTIIDIDEINNYAMDQIVIITTGSQGEPMSALTRMAMSDHRKVGIVPGDTVIISATPIPGNEKLVAKTVDNLLKLGANVIYGRSEGIHVSGHAAREELKLMHNLVRPKFFIPVHGEQKHMRRHAELALSVGIPEKNILVPELGDVVALSENGIKTETRVAAGRIFVDASGVGDVGSTILQDRKKLSTDGVVLVTAIYDLYTGGLMSTVDIQTKGFVFGDNANELNAYIKNACEDVFDRYKRGINMDINVLKQRLKDGVAKAVFDKTKRSPVIIVSVFAV